MKITITCGEPLFEWYDWKDIEIETDDYGSFQIDYRCSNSWHLIGITYSKDKPPKKKELSLCQISYRSLIEFLANVDKPITSFTNGLNYVGFVQTLNKLLADVDKYKEKQKEIHNEAV